MRVRYTFLLTLVGQNDIVYDRPYKKLWKNINKLVDRTMYQFTDSKLYHRTCMITIIELLLFINGNLLLQKALWKFNQHA